MKPTIENIKTIVTPELAQEFANKQDKFLFCLHTLEAKGFNLPSLHSRGASTTEKACEALEGMLASHAKMHELDEKHKKIRYQKGTARLGVENDPFGYDAIEVYDRVAFETVENNGQHSQDLLVLIAHLKECHKEIFKRGEQLARESHKLSKERYQHKQAKEALLAIQEATQEALKHKPLYGPYN